MLFFGFFPVVRSWPPAINSRYCRWKSCFRPFITSNFLVRLWGRDGKGGEGNERSVKTNFGFCTYLRGTAKTQCKMKNPSKRRREVPLYLYISNLCFGNFLRPSYSKLVLLPKNCQIGNYLRTFITSFHAFPHPTRPEFLHPPTVGTDP